MSDGCTLEQAVRMRRYLGEVCEQHALDCGLCNAEHIFCCSEACRLYQLKLRWLRRVQALKQEAQA